jgi:hypothetical protein
MTWGEFKAAVEAAGIKDDTPLFNIDWDSFYDAVEVAVGADGSANVVGGFKK